MNKLIKMVVLALSIVTVAGAADSGTEVFEKEAKQEFPPYGFKYDDGGGLAVDRSIWFDCTDGPINSSARLAPPGYVWNEAGDELVRTDKPVTEKDMLTERVENRRLILVETINSIKQTVSGVPVIAELGLKEPIMREDLHKVKDEVLKMKAGDYAVAARILGFWRPPWPMRRVVVLMTKPVKSL